MTNLTLTEQQLSSFEYDGLTIQVLPNGKNLLILMSKEEETSTNFLDILKEHPFNLNVSINEEKKYYILEFDFIETEFVFHIKTGKTEDSYPPIVKLKNQDIHYISTGVWRNSSEHGGEFTYNTEIKRLGVFKIETSLQEAFQVQFLESHGSPAAIVLTFTNHPEISLAEADKAYNRLLEMEQARPNLEIIVKQNGLIDLRIWDIAFDLDIRIKDLSYTVEELNAFLQSTSEKGSFLFALGLPSHAGRPVLVSTKSGEPQFFRIYGYKYTELADTAI